MLNLLENPPVLQEAYFSYRLGEKTIHIFPTIHDDIGFSFQATEIFEKLQPDVVALELPQSLDEQIFQAIERLPTFTLIHKNPIQDAFTPDIETQAYIAHPGDAIYWLGFLAHEYNRPIVLLDELIDDKPVKLFQSISFHHIASIGWSKYYDLNQKALHQHAGNDFNRNRTANIIDNILNTKADNLLVVVGALHYPFIHKNLLEQGFTTNNKIFENIDFPIIKSKPIILNQSNSWFLSEISTSTLYLSTTVIPYNIVKLLDNYQNGIKINLLEITKKMYFDAHESYKKKFDDTLSLASFVRLFQYLRNLSRIKGLVIPDLVSIIEAAKGMGDDDFAYEVYRVAITYPFSVDEKLENEVKFQLGEDQASLVKMVFKRRYRRPIEKLLEDDFDEFDPLPEEEYEGEWSKIWEKYSEDGYVSHPPEDEYLEGYLRVLEGRLNQILMEENTSTIQFDTSLEDGIDWRETILHHQEKKIYVKKFSKNIPKVGVIVLQFHEEPLDDQYRYYSTLYAEHDKESHLSMITTEVGKEFIGPGICRIRYAALVSQYPPVGIPRRIPISSDNLKLRLIYAAMNMSLTKIIGFVSPKPPTQAQRHFASEYGFRLLHLPLVQLSKSSMHRLQTMHLLANRDFRDIAKDYIGY